MNRKFLQSVEKKKEQFPQAKRNGYFLTPQRQRKEQNNGRTQELLQIRKFKNKNPLSISSTFSIDDYSSGFNSFCLQTSKKKSPPKERIITEQCQQQNSQRRKCHSFHTQQEQAETELTIQGIDKTIKLKIRIYFNSQKMQNRLVKLIQLFQQINLANIYEYFQDISSSMIDILSNHFQSYKRFVINECISIILFLLITSNIIKGNDKNKWERLLIYYHQANNVQFLLNQKIQITGFQNYLDQYYSFQSLNPLLPSKIDRINMIIEQNIDTMIKSIEDKQLCHQLMTYRQIQIGASFLYYQQKLKVILNQLERYFYLIPKKIDVFTLVLDLDETLVHYLENTSQILIRPYTSIFLEQISKYYEIVIFTAAIQSYADQVINLIDPSKSVMYRLYRHHTSVKDNIFLKDLNSLGRPLTKTVIVDNNPYNFSLQPQNGIKIKAWTGEENDRGLIDIMHFLVQLHQYDDIRIGLKEIECKSKYFQTNV